VQSLVGKAKSEEAMPGLLVTKYGKIVPGQWLQSQAAANAGRLATPAPIAASKHLLRPRRR